MTETVSGADALARLAAGWGRMPVFHVPGEGVLEVVDALDRAGAPMLSFRHEAGAAVAAQAAGHITGRPAICLAGRAPGALNCAQALHTARTDAAPMILIVGQPSRGITGREPFLDNDFASAFSPMAKWAGTCREAARLPELFARAWSVALDGQRGPVVLAVHEEVWTEELDVATIPEAPPQALLRPVAGRDVETLSDLIEAAERPVLVAGGTGWTAEGAAALASFADATGLPVATSYRRRDLMPAAHPCFAGELGIGMDPALAIAIGRADLVVVLGMRLGEINTFGTTAFAGYTLIDESRPQQRLAHVHRDPTELNAVYRTDLAICADPAEVVAGLAARGVARRDDGWPTALRAARQRFTEGTPCPGPLDLRDVFRRLRASLPPDALMTVGAGAYAHWPQRYFDHHRFGTLLGPKSGAMGYGLPAAIGAASVDPGRRIVAVAGDGCFLMQGEEMATAVLYRLPIVVLIVNNAAYGAIAAAQERHFGRKSGVDLAPIDFAAYAHAMGAAGFTVTTTEGFGPALEAALACDGPAVIDLRTGPEALKP